MYRFSEFVMKKNIITRLSYIFSLVVLGASLSCSNVEDYAPSESFIKIYNNPSFESSYIPIDMVQAGSNGYFILSAYDKWNTYILRVDSAGEFMWDYNLEQNLVNPIEGIFYENGSFFFFCMDEISLATQLMKADDGTKSASVERVYGDIIYPLHASVVDDGYLLESYNRESYSTRLTKFNASFGESWHEEYEVEQDVEESIISHLARIGDRLPFFTGQAGNRYFLNGYNNYSMSLLWVTASGGALTGVINGFRDESVMSSALYLDGNYFALSRYSYGENVVIPRMEINTSSIGISTELEGNIHPEIVPDAFVHSQLLNIYGQKVVIYATTTKAGEILLYAYDAAAGTLVGTYHLGHINPYSAIDFTNTTDGGLAILGNTFVNGRFSRIALIKLSARQLDELINPE
jgi:hypothetical protein